MSRVGKIPVQIPSGVKVTVDKQVITVEGPKGKLTQDYLPDVEIEIQDTEGIVKRKDDSKRSKSMHGLYRNLLNNMVLGVSNGFTKTLLITGVGYRAEMGSGSVILNLGYSNPIEYPVPEGIDISLDGQTKIIISGINKQQVGQVAAEIRSLRPPEPYKGKGVRYEDETVKRKVGKAGIK
jgi:large subunit ribosomal protein L6